MLPRTFLTNLIPARIGEALRRVEARIWQPLGAAGAVAQTASYRKHRAASELAPGDFSPVPASQFHWGPKYAQRWFKVTLPAADAAATRYLVWEDQGEATLYLDGMPYSGLDLAHRHCPLPADATALLIESVCIRSAIWLDGRAPALDEEGSLFRAPQLMTRDDFAWSVYHDLAVLLDVLRAEHHDYQPGSKDFIDSVRHTPPIQRASPLFRRWCAALDQAIDIFDRDGLAAFGLELKKIYTAFPAEPGALKAVLTGHGHLDLVWLWPESVGEFKAVHTWATQVRLLREYPEFRFGYSQPASYAAVARRAPALHAQVCELIAAGQWEATGASEVEFDTQLPCGEALVRSLRLGQAGFTALRGGPARVMWLPDVFGYSGCLPQLLRGFGVEGFFTTKLSWSTVNRPPHTSFRWRGPDGAEVAAHLVLLHDYNEAVDVQRLREDALHHQQAAVHPEFLVPTGYGDGGGGPTEAMCERARRVANLAGVPRTEWGGIEAFFGRLQKIAPDLPVVQGELMLEMHRGVFTTHSRLKAAFRGLERALQTWEAAQAAAGAGAIPETFWRRLSFAQFHDCIPGSSVWEVYAETIPELEQLAATALENAAAVLTNPSGEAAWFNPLPFARTWVAGHRCWQLPPLGGDTEDALPHPPVVPPEVSRVHLANERVKAHFTAQGGLAALEIDGRKIAWRGEGHRLCAYPDHPAAFEAWDVDRTSLVAGQPAVLQGGPRVERDGLGARVVFSFRLGRASTVEVAYVLSAGDAVLHLEYAIDWRDPETLLKAIFTTDYMGREARFGAPFGSTLRGQWPGHAREEAMWEVPASRWLVMCDDAQSEGLAIVTEAKYGATVRDGSAGVSLLRSALVTEAGHHPLIRETAERPQHSDLTRHQIKIALGRFAADLPAEMQPAALADLLFTPCLAYRGKSVRSGLQGIDGAPSLMPAWLEPLADGGCSLRAHETLGRRGVARIRLAPGWEAQPVALDGRALPAGWRQRELALPFGPYQVLTLALRPLDHSTVN
ncbi:MAG: Alpha-mannosidase, partial [Lacunisphaera sp.]|nr:Alpha-mannosidase [Lacunisphaera sp.]